MHPDDRKQPQIDEVVSLNADDLDAEKLDQLSQEKLEDVAGGSCTSFCGTNANP